MGIATGYKCTVGVSLHDVKKRLRRKKKERRGGGGR